MEIVNKIDDINELKSNKIIGNFELNNSQIRFLGVNNILFCEENLKLKNTRIFFRGDNSIIYLSYPQYGNFNNAVINVRNDSTMYIGKDLAMGTNLQIALEEHQNFVLGDDGLIEDNVDIRTSHSFPIYNIGDKRRVNYSISIFIGVHVWIDHFAHVSMGSKIGSGAIIGHSSFLPNYSVVPSNTKVSGNPSKIVNKNVFFTKEFTGSFRTEDTKNFSNYKSDVYEFKCVDGETLAMDKVDAILKDLTGDDRFEFIQKLFVRNKRRNRFSI